ncbi:MAG: glutamine--fructose-6-phosphate transaminase (isomerizing) [Armatimonadetes bacterium]|nr:glutamine--fructose-6-phosphate transaminase (isomerizing) [Armatimonadota bacterium]
MCGIVGYIGHRDAPLICVEGLKRLEYRGYDSAGVAVVLDGTIALRKVVGKLAALEELLEQQPLHGSLAIGHTRWATHGKPSVENSHPHLSCAGDIAVVHNGIIENYAELREELAAEGHKFTSQTDTETIAHLIERYYQGNLAEAVRRACHDLVGSFAIGVIHANHPDVLIGARRFSPLVVGLGEGENFIASDMGAIRKWTDKVYVIDDDEMAVITTHGIDLTDLDANPVHRDVYIIPWPADAAEKGGHKHFMHKEIHEQPMAMRECLRGRLSDPDKPIILDGLNMTEEEILGLRKVILSACGTAYHAALVGRFLLENFARIPAEADLAAELRARDPVVLDNTLAILVSQSGETADTLVALRELKEKGAKVVSVINVVDSSIARESDGVVYIQAGPEIGVASTKAYTLQVLTLQMIAAHFAEVRGVQPPEVIREFKAGILAVPDQAAELLGREDAVRDIAKVYYPLNNALYLGRGINLPSAMEGALKLKEISYVHAEGYSAGEMKHGPIALVEPALFTVAIAVQGQVYEKMIGNIQEIKAREGPVIGVANDGDEYIQREADHVIWVPPCPELISPATVQIPLQLLAYHIADLRGCHIDQPRNLAKTVTVE